MYEEKDTTKHYWHIDEHYLNSIWNRIDAYNKGLERAVTMKTTQALSVYRSCWVLLKNVYIDYSPYFNKKNPKDDEDKEDHYNVCWDKLQNLKKWFYSTAPAGDQEYVEWNNIVIKSVEQMDGCKMALIFAMANQENLLGKKVELGIRSRIKQVMSDW